MNYGLNLTPKDERDFVLSGVFGTPELPPDVDFTVSTPLGIKDQRDSSMCVAFASTEVSEDEEEVQLSPEWFYAKIKEREGDPTTYGANLRDAMKVAVNKGFLKQSDAPFSLDTNTQDYLADWTNWPSGLDEIAAIHKKQSYFKIFKRGHKDYFDAIRASLWQFKGKNQSIITGLIWCREWTNAKNGIIRIKGTPEGGHAFKIYGQQFFDGEPFLICQLSNGTQIGDGGIFYISREVINDCEEYGAFMLVDLPKEQAEFLTTYNLTIKSLWFAKIIIWLRNFLNGKTRG